MVTDACRVHHDGDGVHPTDFIDVVLHTFPHHQRDDEVDYSLGEVYSSSDEQLHNLDTPYICSTCNKQFKYQSNLRRHHQIHLASAARQRPPRLHACDICNKCFTYPSDLKRHSAVHADTKPHRCQHCNKTYSQSYRLKVHMARHRKQEQPQQQHRCTQTEPEAYHNNYHNHYKT